jgi:hypothetical protein
MTLKELKVLMPPKKQKFMNQELVDMINDAENRGDFDGEFEKKVISYSSVLTQGRYKTSDYIAAVEFCTYYLSGDEQAEAYVKTFPDKVRKRVLEGKSPYATGAPSMYYSGQLVQAIMAQAQMSVRMRHYNKIDFAVETLFELATSKTSTDRIRMESADKLLTQLKEPENSKVELEIGIKKDESGQALEAKMLEVAVLQKEAFEKGIDLITLQKLNIKEGEEEDEVIDVEAE